MIDAQADLLLAPEAFEEDHVALELDVGDLQDDRPPGLGVGSLEDRSHSAPGEELFHPVLVERAACCDIGHGPGWCTPRAGDGSANRSRT